MFLIHALMLSKDQCQLLKIAWPFLLHLTQDSHNTLLDYKLIILIEGRTLPGLAQCRAVECTTHYF